MFDVLPLAALVNDAVFLCHGGISPDLGHPRDVNRIERPQVGLRAAGLDVTVLLLRCCCCCPHALACLLPAAWAL